MSQSKVKIMKPKKEVDPALAQGISNPPNAEPKKRGRAKKPKPTKDEALKLLICSK
jgi:hypothetical protein